MADSGLDITAPSPRVNGQLMAEFVGKRVTLVGKTEGTPVGTSLQLRAPDNAIVTVNLPSVAPEVAPHCLLLLGC